MDNDKVNIINKAYAKVYDGNTVPAIFMMGRLPDYYKALIDEARQSERAKIVEFLKSSFKDFHTGYGDYVLNENEKNQLIKLIETYNTPSK